MATYRYLFADLLTNAIIGELPLTDVGLSQQLNSAGTLQGSILLTDIASGALNIVNSTVPARTAVYVDRDGVLVWGGVLWGRSYNSVTQRITLTAREFESYFEKRRITTTTVYSGVDQFTVAQALINAAQSVTGGNIGVRVGSDTSGVTVSRTFYSYELKSVYSALQDLSRSSAGFDFTISVVYDAGRNIVKTLKLGYPQLGTVYSSSNATAPVLEYPAGNIIEYEYPEDGSLVANYIWAVGGGSNEGKTIKSASDASKLTAGWPLLEESANYTDIVDSALLTNLAAGQVAVTSYPPVTLKVVVAPYIDPVFGTYSIGDDVRIRIKDDRFPNGLDEIYRLVSLTLSPGENGPERATLVFNL